MPVIQWHQEPMGGVRGVGCEGRGGMEGVREKRKITFFPPPLISTPLFSSLSSSSFKHMDPASSGQSASERAREQESGANGWTAGTDA